jgi:lipopolysaccharide/colanic/teichoic acid biosynthesis glycosyltransferase
VLVILSPVIVACALTILCIDGWPVLCLDTRMGRGGKPFRMVKFRSMRLERGLAITAGDDRRITALGARLRRWKLDELPQLWNVVRGEMSLIGPRPENPALVDLTAPEWKEVLKVAPGITGAASVEYYNEDERLRGAANPVETYRKEILPVKLAIERSWLRTSSPLGDLRLLARTISRVIQSLGSGSMSWRG